MTTATTSTARSPVHAAPDPLNPADRVYTIDELWRELCDLQRECLALRVELIKADIVVAAARSLLSSIKQGPATCTPLRQALHFYDLPVVAAAE